MIAPDSCFVLARDRPHTVETIMKKIDAQLEALFKCVPIIAKQAAEDFALFNAGVLIIDKLLLRYEALCWSWNLLYCQ